MSLVSDIRRWFPDFPKGPVFDVGANIGQTVAELQRENIDIGQIWSFEPVASTFSELCSNFPQVNSFHLALGDRDRDAWVTTLTHSVNNTLTSSSGVKKERTKVVRGDVFCEQHNIKHIAYLKIDTEGHDLHVVRGFSKMLKSQSVNFIMLEVSMNPLNKKHVNVVDAISEMESLGYFIFRVYEQVHEHRRPTLRRSNVLFISRRCIDGYR